MRQKPRADQMYLATMREQNMQWSKYNAKALLFPKLTEEQMQNLRYDKQILLIEITRENFLHEVIKLRVNVEFVAKQFVANNSSHDQFVAEQFVVYNSSQTFCRIFLN